MKHKHVLIPVAVVALVTGGIVAVAHAAGPTASCTQAPTVSDTGTGQRITVTCVVPKPPASTVTVKATATATVTTTVTASPSAPPPTATATATASATATVTPTPTPTPTPQPTGTGCAVKPSACGFPDGTNTGTTGALTDYPGGVRLDQDGQVFANAVVHGSIDIYANNVTVRNVKIIDTGQSWAIGLRHTANAHIENCTITPDGGPRLEVAIKDVYGDATGTSITGCDISGVGTGIQTHEGLIADNFIHDMAMISTDHVNGTTSNGATTPLTIRHNTIFNQFGQTDAVSLFQDFGVEANRSVVNNLLAGGGYTLYGGMGGQGQSHDIVVTGNRFSTLFYPASGSYGPVAYFDTAGTGNVWSGNVWADGPRAGQPVTP